MSRRRPKGSAGGIAVVLAGLVLGVSLLTQGPPSGSPGASVPQAQVPAGVAGDAEVASPRAASAGLGAVAWEDLPAQAHVTYRLILAGGPFPYDRDGTVFFNRERLLPQQARGYYREYTVDTPGLTHRGARRIVCGGEPPTQPQVCYYTDDHYASFRYIQTNQ